MAIMLSYCTANTMQHLPAWYFPSFCACLSVTSRYHTKVAKHIITKTTPYNNLGSIFFCC